MDLLNVPDGTSLEAFEVAALGQKVGGTEAFDAAIEKGGVFSYVTRAVCGVQAAWTFGRLFMMDTLEHELPVNTRMAPSW